MTILLLDLSADDSLQLKLHSDVGLSKQPEKHGIDRHCFV